MSVLVGRQHKFFIAESRDKGAILEEMQGNGGK